MIKFTKIHSGYMAVAGESQIFSLFSIMIFRVLRLVLTSDLSEIKPISDGEFWQEIPPTHTAPGGPGTHYLADQLRSHPQTQRQVARLDALPI